MATIVDEIKTPGWSMASLLTTGTYWTLWGFFRSIARLCFQLRLTGQENIPAQGGLLIAANHASFLDVPFLGCGVARQLAFLGRHNLFPIPLVNPLLQRLGWIPIRQDRFDRDGLRRAEDCIEKGKALVIFPEGAHTETGALGEGETRARDAGPENQMSRGARVYIRNIRSASNRCQPPFVSSRKCDLWCSDRFFLRH